MSQSAKILKHLQSGRCISTMQAFEKFGCTRLSARILELKRQGHSIVSEMVTKKGVNYCQYLIQ